MGTKDSGLRVFIIIRNCTLQHQIYDLNVLSNAGCHPFLYILEPRVPTFLYFGIKGANIFVFWNQGGQLFLYILGHINMVNFVISNQYLNLILVVYDSMWILSESHFVISNQYLNLILVVYDSF